MLSNAQPNVFQPESISAACGFIDSSRPRSSATAAFATFASG
jgi:hypothetical protein